ncbi:MAG: peptide MFS transporter [Gemmatimonadaceae bacterium]|nr:peptide MFS transporter [Gemmatimonadaceae bacterium]
MPNDARSVFDQPQAAALAHDEPPALRYTSDTRFFGHPRGLSTAFFTEFWERFSYYGIRPLLVLFMTAALTAGGLGFDRENAAAIVGIYASSVYLASLPGGWIADRWLGLQRSIFWGGVLIALGHLAIGLSALLAHQVFFLGLILIVFGTGMLKPNVSAIVGDLYPEGGARRDAGFAIFYMGINFGAFAAPIITGWLSEKYGWHWGFGAAGVGMLIGIVTYRIRTPRNLGPIGARPSADAAGQRRVRNIVIAAAVVIATVVLAAMAGAFTINPRVVAERMTIVIGAMAVLYFGYLFLFAGLDADEKKRSVVILVLFVFSACFWSAYEQAPTSLNLFAKDFTDRRVGSFEVPIVWLQSATPIFVILLSPVFAVIWSALGKRGRDFSSPAKFAFALACAGLSYVVMVTATNRVIAGGGVGVRVSMLWLVVTYLLQVIGELSLSPVGLSSTTKLAPHRFVGQMMGVWFMSIALGNLVAGLIGGNVDPEKLAEMPALFQHTATTLFVAAGILLVLVVPIRRMMDGRRSG